MAEAIKGIDAESLQKWKKAGEITARALDFAMHLCKDGALLLEFAEKVEAKMVQLGGKPAFPINISMNHVAAHYTPYPNDKTEFNGQLVKIDVGVHVDGFIGDSAITVDLGKSHDDLVKASRKALDDAVKIIKPGIKLGEIGEAIESAIKAYGFVPIKNLSGHGLGVYGLHTGLTIPNFNTGEDEELNEGMVVAIEPFATDGAGFVVESSNAEIFSLVQKKPVRSMITREIMGEIGKYNGMPFTTRWLAQKFPLFKVNFALKELNSADSIRLYPPLVEKNKGMVSQAEHSIIVRKDKPLVLTQAED